MMDDIGKGKNCTERLVVPVAVYTPTGKNTFTAPVQFFRMELTTTDYEQLLRALEDEEVTPDQIPFKAFKITGVASGKGQYSRIAPEFKVKGDSLITKDLSLKVQVSEFLAKYNEAVKDSIAKTITEEKLIKLVEEFKISNGEVTEQAKTNPATEVNVKQSIPSSVSTSPSVNTIPEVVEDYMDGYDLDSILKEVDLVND